MKKLKIVALLGVVACTCAAFAACGTSLGRPNGLSYDKNNYTVEWNPVENAYSYKIQIKDVDSNQTWQLAQREPAYSISELSLEEGYYEVQVKAVARGGKNKDSQWSTPYKFYKEYETGCVYTLINNTEYEITDVTTSTKGKVVIEDFYKDKPVTSIAENAFKGAFSVTEVVLGANIKTIGDNAFYNCKKLEKVTFNENLESIGSSAFQNCSALKEITLPKNITKLNDATFGYCRALERVTLNDKLEYVGASAFEACSALTSITIPDSVKELGKYAFSNCYKKASAQNPATGLISVTIGKNVQTIGGYAFENCILLEEVNFAQDAKLKTLSDYAFSKCETLTEIELPSNLESIGYACFWANRNLNTVNIPDSVLSVGGYAFSETKLYENSLAKDGGYVYADKWLIGLSTELHEKLKEITLTSFKSGIIGIADETFLGCPALTKAVIPQSVQAIGDYAFYNCAELWRVQTYDNSLKVIGESAFEGCKKLNQLLLGKGLEKIGAYAFYNCEMLTGMNLIPDSVVAVGAYAFRNTAIWREQTNKGDPIVYVGKWIVGYNENGNLTTVNLPAPTSNGASVVGIADYAFYKCEALSSIYGMDQVEYIGRAAFYECTNLAALTLNRSLTEIKEYTFYKCSSLFRVTMPRALRSIGRSAFYKCEQLDLIDLSDSNRVTYIDDYAFYGCFNAKSLTLSEGIEEIGDYAFYKCTSIKELTIPSAVRVIGEKAFSRCELLETLTIETEALENETLGLETIKAYAFSNCVALKSVVLPDSVVSVGNYAFYKCEALEEISIGAKVETIGDYAFYNCSNVTSLRFPSSVNEIGRYAFKGANLDSLVLSSDVLVVDEMAFYGNQMTVYTDVTGEDEMTWNEKWNRGFRPVVWGCTLSEDNAYVVSVTVTSSTFENVDAVGGVKGPMRDGYVFAGWSTNANATVGEIAAADLPKVAVGTTVYAVWQPVPVEG